MLAWPPSAPQQSSRVQAPRGMGDEHAETRTRCRVARYWTACTAISTAKWTRCPTPQVRVHLDECGPCLREFGLEEAVKRLVHKHCGS